MESELREQACDMPRYHSDGFRNTVRPPPFLISKLIKIAPWAD